MTLSNALAARVGLIVWCKECQHQVVPDPAEMAAGEAAGDPSQRHLAAAPDFWTAG
jgi:hypothetical protein